MGCRLRLYLLPQRRGLIRRQCIHQASEPTPCGRRLLRIIIDGFRCRLRRRVSPSPCDQQRMDQPGPTSAGKRFSKTLCLRFIL